MKFEDLKGKNVGILGLGREGQAVWRQIRKRFPGQAVSFFAESKSPDEFVSQLNPDLDHCYNGPFECDQLVSFDVLIRSAGISPYREVLTELRTLGVPFTTANSLWFAENPGAKTICVTGTKGKSTTAALIAHLINHSGHRACLTGNIGRPMLDCDPSGVDWWVIELSSYQLSDLQARTDIGVLLNLSHEHVDWHGSVEAYRADKLRLSELVVKDGLVANHSDPVLLESLKVRLKRAGTSELGDISWFNSDRGWVADKASVSYTPAVDEAPTVRIGAPESLPGQHNMQNLAAALTVLEKTGLHCQNIQAVLDAFTGLPHRLERLGTLNSVSYVDDSISTTPVSVTAALETLDSGSIVLLLGGLDRGLAWDEFAASLWAHRPHAIITMPDNGPVIFRAIQQSMDLTGAELPAGLHAVNNLRQAVALAQQLVPLNGCILLSPGAPSFPHFRDFEDRGNQFAQFAGIGKAANN